jgi:phosphatidylglycerophosphate synthase
MSDARAIRQRAVAVVHALSMAGAAAAAVASGRPLWFSAGGVASIFVWVVLADRPWARGELATLANLVTACRAGATAALPVLHGELAPLAFTLLLVGLLAVDGVDGAIARRTGRSTAFGGRLDLETDAFLTLMMCLLLLHAGLVGGWVLVAGMWRYVYAAFVAVVPARGEEPRSRLGRYVAGTLIVSLASGFLLGPRWAPPVVAIGTALVSYSFLRSLAWSLRRR